MSAAFAARKQLQDKAQSLLRGLEHVQHCRQGDACGRALCHSTKRLLRTYVTHECPRRSAGSASATTTAADCRVCRLWQLLLAEKTRKSGEMAAAADDLAPPVVRPACGLAALATRLATRPALHRRVLVAAKEADTSRRG